MGTLDGLAPNETLGIILALVVVGTIIVIIILLAAMACRYCFYRREQNNVLKLQDSSGGGGRRRGRGKKQSLHQQQQQERISRIADGTSPASTWLTFNVDASTSPEMAAAPQEKEPLTATEPEAIEMEDNISPSSQVNGIPPAAPNQPTQKLKAILQSRQFPRGDLLLVEKIGEGEYGPIYRGEAYNLGVKDESRAVAVKMLAPIEGAEVNPNLQLFQDDIEMLMSVNHLNVVGMLAVCTQDSPECILLDAGLPGDLLKFIHGKKEQRLSTLSAPQDDSVELLKIGEEIALGMVYLSSEHFVHKDLALRNCIIGYDGVVKVAHFGLGPVLHPEAYYRVSGNDFPVRWMPPESIVSGNFTTMSDIWAFGVLLWELFTYGDLPYPHMDNEETIGFVTKEFGRLSRPDGCPDDVFSIMTSCWAFESHMRPTFAILQEQIADLISLERESPSIMESLSPARSPDLPAPLY